jgi:beta-glucosidase
MYIMGFKKDFIWGAASSAYQIEGAKLEGGKGLSVWDMMCRKQNAIKGNDTGDIACDHFYRYKEDVRLMKEIGLKAYRFSISWPRVIPDGVGKVNVKGLDFYDRLTDSLLENSIEPYLTLFHWDFPYELYKKGGWLNSDSSGWFAEYTKVIVEKLSDRVKNWITINEPKCYVLLGHQDGVHAPGLKLGVRDILQIAHNTLLAHGKSVQVIRSLSKQPCRIGYAPVGNIRYPRADSVEDIEAARSEMFLFKKRDLWINSWWMDPVFFGRYPSEGLELFKEDLPEIKIEDLKIISQPVDFFGVNIYHGAKVFAGKNGMAQYDKQKPGYPKTANNWQITPECIYWGSRYYYERYKKPILIAENGISNIDWVCLDGSVHDPQRIDFINRYLLEFKRAAQDGVDLEGYFYWSAMDNFEWAEGYNERFGLIHVDYQTQKRTIKDSGYWYKKVIESNGLNL